MKTKNGLQLILATLLLSGLLITTVSANGAWPNLPVGCVNFTLVNPPEIDYPFAIQLNGIQVGYDVTNKVYTGYCVDVENTIGRETYNGYLVSSLSPESGLNTFTSKMINYIINHPQGSGESVQEAIWYFVNGEEYFWNDSPYPSQDAIDMVQDAKIIGINWVQTECDKLAVVIIPCDEIFQKIIIEIQKCCRTEGLTPGFWKNHESAWAGYSTDESFEEIFDVDITISAGKKTENESPTLLEALSAKGGVNEDKGVYDALIRHAVAAILNAANPNINYPLTETEIINAVHDAIIDGNPSAELLKNELDSYNNLGASI